MDSSLTNEYVGQMYKKQAPKGIIRECVKQGFPFKK